MYEIWPFIPTPRVVLKACVPYGSAHRGGSGTQLDGVLMVDPVFLQELVKINGNITLSDGRVLTGDTPPSSC